MEILEIIIWPLVVLIIAIIFFLIFKNPLIQLINRIQSIKSSKFDLDTNSSTEKQVQQKDEKKLKLQEIERALNLFNKETREYFQKLIKDESEWDKTDDYEKRFEILLKYSEALLVISNFERIYNLIFGSQIKILKTLNSVEGIEKEKIENAYRDTIQESNEILKDYPFAQYLSFLENNGLIAVENGLVRITWLGRDFLKYLIDKGLTDNKPN